MEIQTISQFMSMYGIRLISSHQVLSICIYNILAIDDFARVVFEKLPELVVGIITAKFSAGFGDFRKIANMMRVGTKTKNELIFGELFDGFLGVTAILTEYAAKIAL